jgi:hypothetical protein
MWLDEQPAIPQPSSLQTPQEQVWHVPPLQPRPLQQSAPTLQLPPLGLQQRLPVQAMPSQQSALAPQAAPRPAQAGQSPGQLALVSVPLGSQQPSPQVAAQSAAQVQLVSPGSQAPLGHTGGGAWQSAPQVCQSSLPVQQPSPQTGVGQSAAQLQAVSVPLQLPSPQQGEHSGHVPQGSPARQQASPQTGGQSWGQSQLVSVPLQTPSPQQANTASASRSCCQWLARTGVAPGWIGSKSPGCRRVVPVNVGAS